MSPVERQLRLWYYQSVKNITSELFRQIYSAELFGKKCRKYNLMNDIHYLLNLLQIIYKEWNSYFDEEMNTFAYWDSKYGLSCIIKGFQCKGINVAPLLGPFMPTDFEGIPGYPGTGNKKKGNSGVDLDPVDDTPVYPPVDPGTPNTENPDINLIPLR